MAHFLLDDVAILEQALRGLHKLARWLRRMRLFAKSLDQADADTGLELANL
jgi:hypothetical protein